MIKVGDNIVIRYSDKLVDAGNELLVNKAGVVTGLKRAFGKVVGVYADVRVFRKSKNYYIPLISVEGPDDISRSKTFKLLKQTVL